MRMRQMSPSRGWASDACLDCGLVGRRGKTSMVPAHADASIVTSPTDGLQSDRVVHKWPQVARDGYAAVPVIAADVGSRRYIARVLQRVGFKVVSFAELPEALSALARQQYDAVVLSGRDECVEWCSAVHELRPDLPVLFVLQDAREAAVAHVLDAGADCLEAPFLESDLIARARLLFRLVWRRHGLVIPGSGNSIRLDLVRPGVHVGGREVALTKLEYRTLWVLSQDLGGISRFSDIERSVWGDAAGARRLALRGVIAGLRQKLIGRSDDQLLLQTEPRVGYRLLSSWCSDADRWFSDPGRNLPKSTDTHCTI